MFHLAYRKKKIEKEMPLVVFEKLRGEYSALLYSGQPKGAKPDDSCGRYTYIGYEPFMLFESKGGIQEISSIQYDVDGITRDAQMSDGEPLEILKVILGQLKVKSDKDLPPFVGGAMGLISYDFGLTLHGIPYTTADDLELPDMFYALYDKVIAFDHLMNDLYFFGLGETKEQAQQIAEEVFRDATKGLSYEHNEKKTTAKRKRSSELNMYLSKADYLKKITDIKQYLKDGESYQVNFSQRFSYETTEEAWEIFRRLAEINPSPFSCYFEHPEFTVISSSPEKLISATDGLIETKPIKGTRARGKTEKEDVTIEKDLLDSKKDEAELTMIVDLMRNDIGMICEPKSVKVLSHRTIEKFSHVMHTVTTIRGKLKKGMSIVDLVAAVFPGGSVTGCPKKRTMEIIAKLEDFHRDFYCGSAGYFSVSGNMALNILIRTMVHRFGEVFFHSGGGIVMDSDAEAEFNETLDKAQALLESLVGD